MSRSFSAECAAIGLSQLESISNSDLSEGVTRSLKDFSSHLRKKGEQPLPQHRALSAVSNAAGFPSWDAFVRATRHLAAQSEAHDSVRSGFCDTLPLLVKQPNFRKTPAAAAIFDTFSKRVQGHTGYSAILVNEALAEHWGEESYDAMRARTGDEWIKFLIEISGDVVWPNIVGPMRELLEDRERRAALSAAIYAAALRDAEGYAAELEKRLLALGKDFSEQEHMFLHAKALKDLPWGRHSPAHNKAYDLCTAYGYWAFCRDAAGKRGTRTWKQFYSRHWQGRGDPFIPLNKHPLITSVPCPSCDLMASVRVVVLPSKYQKDESWALTCTCGHRESKSRELDYSLDTFAPDSILVGCRCCGCSRRRQEAANRLAPFAKDIGKRMVATLTEWAHKLEQSEVGQSEIQLTETGEVLHAGNKACDYRERPIAGKFPKEGSIAQTLRSRQVFLWPAPVSKYLHSNEGFLRRLETFVPKDLVKLVFKHDLEANSPFWAIRGAEEKQRIEEELHQQLHVFLAGFTRNDDQSFRVWLQASQRFIGNWWFAIPAIVTVATTPELLLTTLKPKEPVKRECSAH